MFKQAHMLCPKDQKLLEKFFVLVPDMIEMPQDPGLSFFNRINFRKRLDLDNINKQSELKAFVLNYLPELKHKTESGTLLLFEDLLQSFILPILQNFRTQAYKLLESFKTFLARLTVFDNEILNYCQSHRELYLFVESALQIKQTLSDGFEQAKMLILQTKAQLQEVSKTYHKEHEIFKEFTGLIVFFKENYKNQLTDHEFQINKITQKISHYQQQYQQYFEKIKELTEKLQNQSQLFQKSINVTTKKAKRAIDGQTFLKYLEVAVLLNAVERYKPSERSRDFRTMVDSYGSAFTLEGWLETIAVALDHYHQTEGFYAKTSLEIVASDAHDQGEFMLNKALISYQEVYKPSFPVSMLGGGDFVSDIFAVDKPKNRMMNYLQKRRQKQIQDILKKMKLFMEKKLAPKEIQALGQQVQKFFCIDSAGGEAMFDVTYNSPDTVKQQEILQYTHFLVNDVFKQMMELYETANILMLEYRQLDLKDALIDFHNEFNGFIQRQQEIIHNSIKSLKEEVEMGGDLCIETLNSLWTQLEIVKNITIINQEPSHKLKQMLAEIQLINNQILGMKLSKPQLVSVEIQTAQLLKKLETNRVCKLSAFEHLHQFSLTLQTLDYQQIGETLKISEQLANILSHLSMTEAQTFLGHYLDFNPKVAVCQ